MKRHFVIGAHGLTAPQEDAFRKLLSSKGIWWHWINNFWLFTTNDTSMKVDNIVDSIEKINPNAHCLIIEFPRDHTWAGRGPLNENNPDENMFLWLKDYWP